MNHYLLHDIQIILWNLSSLTEGRLLLNLCQEMQPLFLAAAQPMKVEWKTSPYFRMLALVFRAQEMRSFCWAQGISQTPGLAITPIAEACIGQGALVKHHHDPHS
ncbi:hypothetical protein DBR06_SOUSAS13710032, partial [Sousa chinensis]